MYALGVVGHVDRAEMAVSLAAEVGADAMEVDDGTLGCEANHRRVWARLARYYTDFGWSVVLEDDAVPVADFDAQLSAALNVAPAPIVSLYLGRLRPPQHQPAISALVESDPAAHWFVARRLLHAVGVAIRTDLVPDMLALIGGSGRPIDEAISSWAAVRGLPVAYTWPSLVDHADTPTVIARHADGRPRAAGRVAWRCGGRPAWCADTAPLALR